MQAVDVAVTGREKTDSAGAKSPDASLSAYGAVKVHAGETGSVESATLELR